MHKFILYFCFVVLPLATANPFPYELLGTEFDDTNLYDDIPNTLFAPSPEQYIPQPDSPELLAEGDDEGGSGSSGPLVSAQVFCKQGYLRACCSYTATGRVDGRTGHKIYSCTQRARDGEACDTEYNQHYTRQNPKSEMGGDMCCEASETRGSSTGELPCLSPDTSGEAVRPGSRGSTSENGSIRIAPWGQ